MRRHQSASAAGGMELENMLAIIACRDGRLLQCHRRLAMYDPRYLAGIVLFNRGDFFEAHEVWESLWMETHGPEKPFVQGLIQAAVGLCHFCNGNVRGAVKLYRSSRDYMQRF